MGTWLVDGNGEDYDQANLKQLFAHTKRHFSRFVFVLFANLTATRKIVVIVFTNSTDLCICAF